MVGAGIMPNIVRYKNIIKLIIVSLIAGMILPIFPVLSFASNIDSIGFGKIAAGGNHSIIVKPDGSVWTWGINTEGQLGYGTTDTTCAPVQVKGPGGSGNLSGVMSVAAGEGHSVAIKSDGTIWAWGRNGNGQLGNGTTSNTSAPIQVKGAGGSGNFSNALAAAGGEEYTLVAKSDGTLWGWGRNSDGQLGNGTKTDTTTPVQVSGLSGVVAVATGDWHSLAVKSDGTVWSWGWNSSGEIGNGSPGGVFEDVVTPTQVSGPDGVGNLTGVVGIAGGEKHSLAVKSDGTVWAWGLNDYGQLGDGTQTNRATPVQVQGLSDVVAVAAAIGHSLALKSDGTVWAWGDTAYGELGNGEWNNNGFESTPVQVTSLTGMLAIAAGDFHSMSLRSDGAILSWGYNSGGELGVGYSGQDIDTRVPSRVKGPGGTGYISNISTVTAGEYFSVALKGDSTLWSWGCDGDGQLGDGSGNNKFAPGQIEGFTGVRSVIGSSSYSLAIKPDKTLSWWGLGSYEAGVGEFGFPEYADMVNTDTPEDIAGLTDISTATAGYSHVLTIKDDGTVWAFGDNSRGELGVNSYDSTITPSQTLGLADITAVAAGYRHSLAVKSDGTVWAWGANEYGQLGLGTIDDTAAPEQVSALSDVIDVKTGYNHSLALKSDGTVWVWGYNCYGQLGDGTIVDAWMPQAVPGLSNVIAIAAAGWHCLALKSNGTVWSWGYNDQGQLGDGSIVTRKSPVQVSGLSDAVGIATSLDHSFAIKSDGSLWAWGNNFYGQLGIGMTDVSPYATTSTATLVDSGEPIWVEEDTISASDVTETSLKLSWPRARDDVAVSGYKVYKNGTLIDTTNRYETTCTVAGLTAGTQYTFKVEAGDGIGNWSTDGPSLSVATTGSSPDDGDDEDGGGGGSGGGTNTATTTTVELNSDILPTVIDPAKEQVIQNSSGSLTLRIPAGSIEAGPGKSVSVAVSLLAKPVLDQLLAASSKPEGFKSINKAFEFTAEANAGGVKEKITKFTKPVIFEVQLTAEDLAGIVDPNKIGLFRLNDNGTLTFTGGKLLGNKLVVEMNGFSRYVLAEAGITFKDMEDHWAKADVDLMASKYIVKGSGGMFNPSGVVTRAQFMAMLVRAMNTTKESQASFRDISEGGWFYPELRKAVSDGIITGYKDGTVRPNTPVTREQVATMVSRAMVVKGKAGVLTSSEAESAISAYSDRPLVSNWAKLDVGLAVNSGILTGKSSRLLAPLSGASRAEAIVMIARFWKI
jgi:alpha-tubulin suppressor-like RCC1 family protein